MTPLLDALRLTAAAALASGLAALPFASRRTLPEGWLGWANALAAGLMLGVAYVLLLGGLSGPEAALAGAATLGVLAAALTGRWTAAGTSAGAQLWRSGAHAGYEGIAIGAALATDWRLGVFTTVAMAVHNVPESAELVAGLRRGGSPLGRAAALAVLADGAQVALAVGTLAAGIAWPAVQPWLTGFAVGALIHLVLAELLPLSYRQAGREGIAGLTIVAMGTVTLLSALLPR